MSATLASTMSTLEAGGKPAQRNVANIQVFDASLSRAYSVQASEGLAKSIKQQVQVREVGAPNAPVAPGYYHSANQFSAKVELYRGSVSTVYKAVHDATGARVILKCYHKKKMHEKHYHKLEREIRVMVAMRGPYVAELYGWFSDEESIWLVLELCEGGDLFKTMLLHGGRLDEHYVCVEIIAPMLRVLEKSHRMSLMHRDIKPENIFLTRASKFRLGDFGLAINWTQEIPFSRSGTLDYMAPEVLRNPASQLQESPAVSAAVLQAKGITPYTSKVDVWAVGVLAYELVVGKPPFEVEDEAQTASLIMYSNNVKFPSAHSAAWADFVKCVLIKDPAARPSAGELMQHTWITSNLAKAISGAAAAGRHSSKEALMAPLALPSALHQQAAACHPLPGFHAPPRTTPAPAATMPAAPAAPAVAGPSAAPAAAAAPQPLARPQLAAKPPTPNTQPASQLQPAGSVANPAPSSAFASHSAQQHHPSLSVSSVSTPTGYAANGMVDRARSCMPACRNLSYTQSTSTTTSFTSAASSFAEAAAAIAAAADDGSGCASAAPQQPQMQQPQQPRGLLIQRQASMGRASPLSKVTVSGGGAGDVTQGPATPTHTAAAYATRPASATPLHHHLVSSAARQAAAAQQQPPASPTPNLGNLMGAHGAHGAVAITCPGSCPPKALSAPMQHQQQHQPTGLPQLQQHLAALRVPDSPVGAQPPAQELNSPMPGPGIKQRSLFHLQRQAMQ